MPGNADNDAFDVARAVKADFPDIHCVVLTPFSHGITKRIQHEDLSIFDYVSAGWETRTLFFPLLN